MITYVINLPCLVIPYVCPMSTILITEAQSALAGDIKKRNVAFQRLKF